MPEAHECLAARRYESSLEVCAGCNATQIKLNAWGWADARCDLNFTAICRMAAKGPCSLPPYTDKTTGAAYLYNSDEMVQADAEQWCNDQGGHLVSYENLAEQRNVEGYFIDGGGGQTGLGWLAGWLMFTAVWNAECFILKHVFVAAVCCA